MKRTAFFLLLLCTAPMVFGQNINGIWKGKLVMEPGGCFPVYNIELQITLTGSRISGNSYHFSDTTNFVKEIFEGSFDSTSKVLLLNELSVATFRIPADCTPCIKKFTLTYHTDGKEEQLRGSWTGKTLDKNTDCPPGSIVLTRFQKSSFEPPPPKIDNKLIELVKEIYVDTGIVKIAFYDNGHIDGDTISVYVNKIPVISRQMLSLKAVTTEVYVTRQNQVHEVVMVGENLGSIPPNTALMVITAGEERHKLNLSSDEKKNAMVRIIYKDPHKVDIKE
ncbi:hypothetical protein ACFS6H_14455 [Terrimonas rubra]|uniref:Lipocalin-like domain-containing protein n=1 Tax=Terrimonas rubra TaxID=1035890 RepID=A0ABW6A839_9BACT